MFFTFEGSKFTFIRTFVHHLAQYSIYGADLYLIIRHDFDLQNVLRTYRYAQGVVNCKLRIMQERRYEGNKTGRTHIDHIIIMSWHVMTICILRIYHIIPNEGTNEGIWYCLIILAARGTLQDMCREWLTSRFAAV